MLIGPLLRRIIKVGQLVVIDADGGRHIFKGASPGARSTVRLHDRRLQYKLAIDPEFHVGEAYVRGGLSIVEGDLYEFLSLLGQNLGFGHPDDWMINFFNSISRLVRPLVRGNHIVKSRRNVAHHYDLSGVLYGLFLDAGRQYSCAYFKSEMDDLEAAQWQKVQRLAMKLLLQPGQNVLDIGSGWGGLALALAKATDVSVTGITLSKEQYEYSCESAEREGLSSRVRFAVQDYREITGRFDRIISVGMFEHVGVGYYDEFFSAICRLLAEDGVFVLHTVGRINGPGRMNPWLEKYIFPGAYSPALSEVVSIIEQKELMITDIEVMRLHYAETLRAWRSRVARGRDEIVDLYDEKFYRMWEMYLTSCEVAFRFGEFVVFQIQIARKHGIVPTSRDYMRDWSNWGGEVTNFPVTPRASTVA